jgi:hypothetical protein
MHFVAILGLSFAHLFWTTRAASAQASIYKSSDCSGDAVVVDVDVAPEYCFAVGGNSIGDLYYDPSVAIGASLVTWSGNNCEGSSAVFDAASSTNRGCASIPFASVQLSVAYWEPVLGGF